MAGKRAQRFSIAAAIALIVGATGHAAGQVPADFNRDGRPDLVWEHILDGWIGVSFLVDGTVIESRLFTPGQVPSSTPSHPVLGRQDLWRICATPDVDGDGDPDLFWQHLRDRWVAVSIMDGTVVQYTELLFKMPGYPWKCDLVASGDFNGDGKGDIVWDSGWLWILYMDGTVPIGTHVIGMPEHYSLVGGAGDMDGDGHLDLVIHDRHTKHVYTWLLKGGSLVGVVPLHPDPIDGGWSIVGVGDMNDDTHPDVLWRCGGDDPFLRGRLALWTMNRTTIVDSVLWPYQLPGYAVAAPK